MSEVEGKYGIYAKVLKDSISPDGIRLTTFEIQYPRIILAELNTHGMLARNSASSRAIPFTKMKEQLTGRPVRFGEANPGMQDKGKDHDALIGAGYTPEEWWRLAQLSATNFSEGFFNMGYHKQVYNRLTEAFQMMKTVITATEWNNFFWLRHHSAADPTLETLAACMYEARQRSEPQLLQPGEWHLPYVETLREDGKLYYFLQPEHIEKRHDEAITMADMIHLTAEDALKVSAARSAAVSFRNVDYGLEKSREVYDRLVGDDRKHGSAMEHQATPIQGEYDDGTIFGTLNVPSFAPSWEPGVTHMDKDGQLWSAKFRGWIMHRKLIPGENVPG